jgi:hypothetical protein
VLVGVEAAPGVSVARRFGHRVDRARIVGLERGGADHDLRAEGRSAAIFSWLTLSGMTKTQLIAADRGDHRQRRARVAAGRLDDRAARLELPRASARSTMVQRDAVLHGRPRRQEEVALHVQVRGEALAETVELHDRRRADRTEDVGEHAVHLTSPRGSSDRGTARRRRHTRSRAPITRQPPITW